MSLALIENGILHGISLTRRILNFEEEWLRYPDKRVKNCVVGGLVNMEDALGGVGGVVVGGIGSSGNSNGEKEKENIGVIVSGVEGKQNLEIIESCYFEGISLLGWVIRLNHLKLLEKLLSIGFDVNKRCDVMGSTALHIAVQYGVNNRLIECMVRNSQKPILYEKENFLGWTAVMVGVDAGNVVTTNTLIKHGAVGRIGLGTVKQLKYNAWLLASCKKQEEKEILEMMNKVETLPHRIIQERYDVAKYCHGWILCNSMLRKINKEEVFSENGQINVLLHDYKDYIMSPSISNQVYGTKQIYKIMKPGIVNQMINFISLLKANHDA